MFLLVSIVQLYLRHSVRQKLLASCKCSLAVGELALEPWGIRRRIGQFVELGANSNETISLAPPKNLVLHTRHMMFALRLYPDDGPVVDRPSQLFSGSELELKIITHSRSSA